MRLPACQSNGGRRCSRTRLAFVFQIVAVALLFAGVVVLSITLAGGGKRTFRDTVTSSVSSNEDAGTTTTTSTTSSEAQMSQEEDIDDGTVYPDSKQSKDSSKSSKKTSKSSYSSSDYPSSTPTAKPIYMPTLGDPVTAVPATTTMSPVVAGSPTTSAPTQIDSSVSMPAAAPMLPTSSVAPIVSPATAPVAPIMPPTVAPVMSPVAIDGCVPTESLYHTHYLNGDHSHHTHSVAGVVICPTANTQAPAPQVLIPTPTSQPIFLKTDLALTKDIYLASLGSDLVSALLRTFPPKELVSVVLSGFPMGVVASFMDARGNALTVTGGMNGLRLWFEADNLVDVLDQIETLSFADAPTVTDFDLDVTATLSSGASQTFSLPVIAALRASSSSSSPLSAPTPSGSLQPTLLRASLAATKTLDFGDLGNDIVSALLRSFPPRDLEKITVSGFPMGMVLSYVDVNGNDVSVMEGANGLRLEFTGTNLDELYKSISTLTVMSAPVAEDFDLVIEVASKTGASQIFSLPVLAPLRAGTSHPTGSPTFHPTALALDEENPLPNFDDDFLSQVTNSPTSRPTAVPTSTSTRTPTTSTPTTVPTSIPTRSPTTSTPTGTPTSMPTPTPTRHPTAVPTRSPSTSSPTMTPTGVPTATPSRQPTPIPTTSPTSTPTGNPTSKPTFAPTENPTPIPTTQQPTPTPTATPDTTFTMTFTFHDLSESQQALVQQAADSWQQIVVGDLEDQPGTELTSLYDFAIGSCPYPDMIDDLHLCVGVFHNFYDGPNGFLGFGGTEYIRENGLPYTGLIFFDPDDVASMSDVIVQHEMGHTLGLGTLWTHAGLVGTLEEGCPYLGFHGNDEFFKISGCPSLPIDEPAAGAEGCTTHLRELMTSTLSNTENPLSRVTIGTLQDLGYDVDYQTADVFDASDLDASCICGNRMLQGDNIISQKEESEKDAAVREQSMAYGKEILQSRVLGLGGRHAGKNSMKFSNTLSVFYRREDGTVGDAFVSL